MNWSAREKVCYTIYCGVKQFEDHLDNRQFILKTDYKNLTYINVTLLGRCCGGNFTFRIKTSISCMFLGKKYINMCLMRFKPMQELICLQSLLWTHPCRF